MGRMTEAPRLQWWFDYSCPYAWLSSTQIEPLIQRTGAVLDPRPMLLGGVFAARGVPQNLAAALSPPKARHGLEDIHRQARRLGVPLVIPSGHPRRTVLALRVTLAAGLPMVLIHRIFRGYWVEQEDIADRAVLALCLADCGLEVQPILDVAESDAIKDDLRARTDEAIKSGMFGAPSFIVGHQLHWGSDRMDVVERALGGSPPPLTAPTAFKPETTVDLWFDFSSPFACLGTIRSLRLLEPVLRLRPMLLGAVFKAIGQVDIPLYAMNDARRAWLGRDLLQQAAEASFPFHFNSAFPMNTVAALRIALQLGPDSPSGRAFIRRVFEAGWTTEDRDLRDPAVLIALAGEQGLAGEDLLAATGAPDVKEALRQSTEEAVRLGVFGAPTFVVRRPGEDPQLFWGNDRIPLVLEAVAA